VTEEEYLETYQVSDYPVPLTTVDTVIFCVKGGQLHVLLVSRSEHPEKGKWALPGGFINMESDSNIKTTAFRKLKEKTGLFSPYLEQVCTIGNAKRDKRGWSLTVLYFALVTHTLLEKPETAQSEPSQWMPLARALETPLAFDHKKLLTLATNRLRAKTRYSALPLQLMPDEFTLSELQDMFEIVLGAKLERKSFRRRFLASGLLTETGALKPTSRRPAALYRSVKDMPDDYVFPGLLDAKPELLEI